jgi:hypothetical protein
MRNKNRQNVLWLGLVAYGLSVVLGSVDAVICYGADGHVAIEAAHDRCCADSCQGAGTGGVQGDREYSIGLNQDCCTDIPIADGKANKCTVNSDKDSCAKVLVNLEPAVSSLQLLPVIQPSVFVPRSSTDNPLTTIILLI